MMQKILEWLFFIIILVVVIVFAVGFLQLTTNGSWLTNACQNPKAQSCIDQRFNECMATERYSREECIQIVSGAK